MMTNAICFIIWNHLPLLTFAYGNIVWSSEQHLVTGFLLQVYYCLTSWESWLKTWEQTCTFKRWRNLFLSSTENNVHVLRHNQCIKEVLEDKGLCRICGKNMTAAEKEIVAVCLWLNKVGLLTYQTVIEVLTGLRNCSVPDFVKLFDFLLQQAKVEALDTDSHTGNILKQIKAILSKAVDVYQSLCSAGEWHDRNKSSEHFNVGC